MNQVEDCLGISRLRPSFYDFPFNEKSCHNISSFVPFILLLLKTMRVSFEVKRQFRFKSFLTQLFKNVVVSFDWVDSRKGLLPPVLYYLLRLAYFKFAYTHGQVALVLDKQANWNIRWQLSITKSQPDLQGVSLLGQ